MRGGASLDSFRLEIRDNLRNPWFPDALLLEFHV
jgi:hypothetical protein